MKILIVDDSRLSRQWAIQALPTTLFRQAEILEADNGEDAVKIYKENKPDLVLMDITMPKKNGFEALEEICKLDSNAFVVMVSADRQKLTKDRVLELGAKDILYKPIDQEILRDVLLAHIKKG
ncbi:MAG: response regulator [Sulfurospirillaceae bacterium]|jgi:two-component system chemotaxis response regulator CheY|nr:response regulator [Sulfurospirillaceae bacterium]MCK9546295.1 response regulator [Sulfurospirillaceae bacterium]MDY0237485.1 response regulator [Campylobacterales bacterium]NLM98927.1 response regulator [Campylobacteraceae bacterium]